MQHQGDPTDRRAPMAAAPMKFNDDGSVAWDDMWDSFCVLALDGGPRHRATMLHSDPADPTSDGYRQATDEIVRGVALVSGLSAAAGEPGWIAIRCHSAGMARWLAEAIIEENVDARATGDTLAVPVAAHFTREGRGQERDHRRGEDDPLLARTFAHRGEANPRYPGPARQCEAMAHRLAAPQAHGLVGLRKACSG